MALDLGGTNFRVLHVKLDDESNIEMDSQIYKMPESVITGDGDKVIITQLSFIIDNYIYPIFVAIRSYRCLYG